MFNLDEINEQTGFANGDLFTDEQEVCAYFTEENILGIFGDGPEQHILDEMCSLVIKNRWHMKPVTA